MSNDVYIGFTTITTQLAKFPCHQLSVPWLRGISQCSCVFPRSKIRPLWWFGSEAVVQGIEIERGQSMFFFFQVFSIFENKLLISLEKALSCVKKYVHKLRAVPNCRWAGHKVICIAWDKWGQIAVGVRLRKQWSCRYSSGVPFNAERLIKTSRSEPFKN
jgi:hypothetical protein